MNDKQKDGQRFPANEEQLVEQTVRMLESRTNEGRSKDDQATAELGQLLRDAAQANLPDSNVDLRNQLIAALDNGESSSSSDEVSLSSEGRFDKRATRSTGRRRFWVAAAATGLLLVGGTIAYNSGFVGTLSNLALLEKSRDAGVDPNVDQVVAQAVNRPSQVNPGVVFRAETKQLMAPVTRTRTETKTRQVPVTKFRAETKQVKQADGSFKEETVQVPYTELTSQSYKVQVPYTENVAQSYTVQVPYTTDGERIEKSDFEKYGLDVAKQSGSATRDMTRDKTLVFPDAETWKESGLRTHFNKFRLADESGKAGDGQPGAPTAAPAYANSSDPREPGGEQNGKSRPSVDGVIGQFSGGQNELSGVDGKMLRDRYRGIKSETQFRAAQKNVLAEVTEPQFSFKGYFGSELPRFEGADADRKGVIELGDARQGVTNLGGVGGDGDGDGDALRKAPERIEGSRKALMEQRWLLQHSNGIAPAHIENKAQRLAKKEEGERFLQLKSDYFDNEPNTGEQYEPIFENAFIAAKGPARISTFSIDVDTASYANMRRLLNSGQRPPANSIRLEELVNYFQYDYAQPAGEHPFSVNLELADCPWQDGHQLLRVGLKGKDVHVAERPATNVVFLIDVSGSMSSSDKLPLLKSGFQMMSRQLGENDRVSIVTYAGDAGVALKPTNGTQTETINNAIERLSSGGSTHGSAGIQLAYELAQQNFIEGGANRVILATDGDLNVGVTSDDALVSLIKGKAAEGVFLTVLGFGTGNLKDGKLEKLADNGNGMYAYIDSTREARRVLVDQLSGSLVTIAKDVKVQVAFNPAEVKSYRLLGYENRMLETKDFDDDRKDAGEIGAGHAVTAIYQLEPVNAVGRPVSLPAGMKYQVPTDTKSDLEDRAGDVEVAGRDGLSKAALSGDLATVALRYKQPEASESQRLEVSIKNQPKRFKDASPDFRFASAVAGFGMYLRNSEHRGSIDADQLQRIASGAIGKDEAGYRSEFIDLIRKASGR